MNRWDEIQGLARDIASNVHVDSVARDRMANDLIKLCGLMIDATAKGVAVDGESSMNGGDGGDGDTCSAYARYLTGERMQAAATEAVTEATTADLERWTRPTPGDPCVCGHVPSVHDGRVCTGERFNGEACKGGPCQGYERRHPDVAWTPKDRRPAALRVRRAVTTTVSCSAFRGGCPNPVDIPAQAGHLGGVGCGCSVSSSVAVAACCYQVTCAVCRNGGKVGGCCYPLGGVCPHHH